MLDFRRVAELLERPLPNLANPLAGDAEHRPDSLERERLASLLEAVVEPQDPLLARGEVTAEQCGQKLLAETRVHQVLDFPGGIARHPLPERRRAGVVTLDRRVERDLDRRHQPRLPDRLHGLVEDLRGLRVGRRATELLGEQALDLGHLHQRRILVERDPDGARLLGERLEDALPHPPDRVTDELHAVGGVELAHRLEQPLVADRHQLREIEAVTLEPLHVGDDEAQVRRDQPVDRDLVPFAGAPGEPDLLLGVRDHRELAYVQQVLIERVVGRGPGEGAGRRSFAEAGHATSHGLDCGGRLSRLWYPRSSGRMGWETANDASESRDRFLDGQETAQRPHHKSFEGMRFPLSSTLSPSRISTAMWGNSVIAMAHSGLRRRRQWRRRGKVRRVWPRCARSRARSASDRARRARSTVRSRRPSPRCGSGARIAACRRGLSCRGPSPRAARHHPTRRRGASGGRAARAGAGSGGGARPRAGGRMGGGGGPPGSPSRWASSASTTSPIATASPWGMAKSVIRSMAWPTVWPALRMARRPRSRSSSLTTPALIRTLRATSSESRAGSSASSASVWAPIHSK